MLTRDDCLAFCALSEDEVAAIAEHEHIPEIVAAELGNYLLTLPNGEARIRRIILDDIAAARQRGDKVHALALKLVLRHFCEGHPAAVPPKRAAHPAGSGHGV